MIVKKIITTFTRMRGGNVTHTGEISSICRLTDGRLVFKFYQWNIIADLFVKIDKHTFHDAFNI